jgi:WD40 repeat protein
VGPGPGAEIARLASPSAPRCLFLPDGKTLVTGDAREMLCLWDGASGGRLWDFRGALGKGTSPAAVSPAGDLLASTGDIMTGDHSIRFWDVAKGAELRLTGSHQDAVSCLAFAPDGKAVLTGSAAAGGGGATRIVAGAVAGLPGRGRPGASQHSGSPGAPRRPVRRHARGVAHPGG